MVDAVTRAIAPHTDVVRQRAQAVERTATGYRVRFESDWLEADQLVLACEAHSASALAAPVDGRVSEILGSVGYSSSMILAMGWHASDFAKPPVGFGFLIPKKERRRLVALTWVGTKFPHRVPDGKIVARCFLGGAEDASVLNESDENVIDAVTRELRDLAGVTAVPRWTRITRWSRSMAQYPVGHPRRMAELWTRMASLPGLHLAGNAYDGIGIPDCIRMGKAAAEKIARP
jgi:oxygen-dependent protoporphyrinogen oxidase